MFDEDKKKGIKGPPSLPGLFVGSNFVLGLLKPHVRRPALLGRSHTC